MPSVCVDTSDWNRNHIPWQTDQWHFLGNQQRIQSQTWDFIWNDSICLVIISAFTQRWKITKLKTKRTLTSMRNNSSSLYFNFISLPSPKAENWVSQLSPTVPLEKDATVNYEQQIHWTFSLFHIRHDSIFLCMCPSCFMHELSH